MDTKIKIQSKIRFVLLAGIIAGLGFFAFLTAYSAFAETEDASNVDPSHEIEQLTKEIEERKGKLDEVEAKKQELQDQLKIIESQTYSIQRQLLAIENQVKDTEFEIEGRTIQIEERKLEIERFSKLIEEKNQEITSGKDRLSGLIRVIDQHDRESTLFVLFSRDSFASYMDELRSAADIQLDIQREVKDLRTAKEELDAQKAEQEKAKQELEESKLALENNKVTLEQQKKYQGELLEESKEQQVPFETLIAEMQQEENFLESQVRSLESQALQNLLKLNQGIISNESVPLAWPVSSVSKPGLNASSCYAHATCSAFFKDPTYFDGRLVHYGVDVPIPQGTPIYAAADGFVAYPFFAGGACSGMGCTSMLFIQHIDENGVATDMFTGYFHLSSAAVQYSDDVTFVKKGQLIGYSGGLPGTMGAGFSTGAHLHFSVSFGKPSKYNYVNPLNYLP